MKKANFVNVEKVSEILWINLMIYRKYPMEIKKKVRIKNKT
jgi:hypothetical protein